ncbi:hypothetical protein VPHK469_0144 [Vibrio phage K469]
MSKYNLIRFEFNPKRSHKINVQELSERVQCLSRGRGTLVTDLANGIITVTGVRPSQLIPITSRMPYDHVKYELMNDVWRTKAAKERYGLK